MNKKAQDIPERLYTNIFIKTCKTYSQQYSLHVKFSSMAMCLIIFFSINSFQPISGSPDRFSNPLLYC